MSRHTIILRGNAERARVVEYASAAPLGTREVVIDGGIARVPLTRGYEAIIDVADVPLVQGFRWSALVRTGGKTVYAGRVSAEKMILMHRVIAKTPAHLVTDHVDGNGLNNRRTNLRVCTRAENQRNVGRRSDNKSGFKGVCFDTRAGKWRAEIRTAGKVRYLGFFSNAAEAAEAYRAAAQIDHGQFARVE